MSNNVATNFTPGDGVRAVKASEQALITAGSGYTLKRLTILGRITATGYYAYYSSAHTEGVGTDTPVAVALNETVFGSAGNVSGGVLLQGTVQEEDLIIHGSNPGVGITAAIKDALRTMGILVESITDYAETDNQT